MSKIPIPIRLLSDMPIAFVGLMSQNLQLPDDLPTLPGHSGYPFPAPRMDVYLRSFSATYDMHPNGRRQDMGGKIAVGSAIIRESEQMAEYLVSQKPKPTRDLDVHFSNIDVLLAREGVLLALVQPNEAPSVISAYRQKGQLVLPSGVVYAFDPEKESEQKGRKSQLGKDGIHALCIARDRRTLFDQN